jgi:ABC-type proline/glycine betaine transport system ATPase subunit
MKETDNVEVADTYQLQRIANALEEILRLVKLDQEKMAKRFPDEDQE